MNYLLFFVIYIVLFVITYFIAKKRRIKFYKDTIYNKWTNWDKTVCLVIALFCFLSLIVYFMDYLAKLIINNKVNDYFDSKFAKFMDWFGKPAKW